MKAMRSRGSKVLLNGISKHDDLTEMSRKGRLVFEVKTKGDTSRIVFMSDILESEGWICEGGKLTLVVPKNALSKGKQRMAKAVHSAISKMKYLMRVAGIDHEMRVTSEVSTKERESVDSVAKFKVALVGDSRVGKTSLVQRFVLDQFSDKYKKTIGTKVSKKEIIAPLPGNRRMRVIMMVWDIVGERNLAELYMQSSFMGLQGIIAVCDVTRKNTLGSVDGWISSVEEVAGKVPIQILVNKMDLGDSHEIESSEVSELSKGYASHPVFTSAKTGENVERAFEELAQGIIHENMRRTRVAVN